jgi:hypothetical protein
MLNTDSTKEIVTTERIKKLALPSNNKIEEQSIFNTSPRREEPGQENNPYENSPKITKSPDIFKHKQRLTVGNPRRSQSQLDAPISKVGLL